MARHGMTTTPAPLRSGGHDDLLAGLFERRNIGVGIAIGSLVLPLAFLLLLELVGLFDLDTSWGWIVVLLAPVVVSGLSSLFSGRRPRPYGRILGAAIGVAAEAAIVYGGITGLSWLLSDP